MLSALKIPLKISLTAARAFDSFHKLKGQKALVCHIKALPQAAKARRKKESGAENMLGGGIKNRASFYLGAAFLMGQALEIRESPAAAAEARPGKTSPAAGPCAPELFQASGPSHGPLQEIKGQNGTAPPRRANGSPRPDMPPLPMTDQTAPQPLEESWKAKLEALGGRASEGESRPEAARDFAAFLAHIASKSHLPDLRHEALFFEELEAAGLRLMPDFRKQDLILIIQSYSRLKIRPGGEFIRHWRAAAAKKKREFSSLDRYGLHGLFRELGIPPLHAPRRAGLAADALSLGESLRENSWLQAAGSLEADAPDSSAGKKNGKKAAAAAEGWSFAAGAESALPGSDNKKRGGHGFGAFGQK